MEILAQHLNRLWFSEYAGEQKRSDGGFAIANTDLESVKIDELRQKVICSIPIFYFAGFNPFVHGCLRRGTCRQLYPKTQAPAQPHLKTELE